MFSVGFRCPAALSGLKIKEKKNNLGTVIRFSPCCQWVKTLKYVQYVHVSLVLWSPELNTVLHLWPHQCWIVWKDHLTQPHCW